MNTRTKHTTVKFMAPFSLRGVEEIQPPGDYAIDEDEELIDGLSWLTYRRVATFIHLPAVSSTDRLKSQLVAIDHSELEAAMRQDEDQARARTGDPAMNVHRFAIGQSVRLKGTIAMSLQTGRQVSGHRENACQGIIRLNIGSATRRMARARCGGKQSRRDHCCSSKVRTNRALKISPITGRRQLWGAFTGKCMLRCWRRTPLIEDGYRALAGQRMTLCTYRTSDDICLFMHSREARRSNLNCGSSWLNTSSYIELRTDHVSIGQAKPKHRPIGRAHASVT